MRTHLSTLLPLLQALSTIFMLFKTSATLLNTAHPFHVVTSESMAPAFHRGDIIAISNRSDEIHVGNIPVIWFAGADLPMVHRAVKVVWGVREREKGEVEQMVLTKGDNNVVDDVVLYPGGQEFVYRDQIVGVVRFYLPFLGWIALFLRENVYVQYGLFGGLVLASVAL